MPGPYVDPIEGAASNDWTAATRTFRKGSGSGEGRGVKCNNDKDNNKSIFNASDRTLVHFEEEEDHQTGNCYNPDAINPNEAHGLTPQTLAAALPEFKFKTGDYIIITRTHNNDDNDNTKRGTVLSRERAFVGGSKRSIVKFVIGLDDGTLLNHKGPTSAASFAKVPSGKTLFANWVASDIGITIKEFIDFPVRWRIEQFFRYRAWIDKRAQLDPNAA